MEIQEIQTNERKNVGISVKTYKSYSKFMKDNKISPTKLFNRAVEGLMKKQE